jgi:hypothetical protein
MQKIDRTHSALSTGLAGRLTGGVLNVVRDVHGWHAIGVAS